MKANSKAFKILSTIAMKTNTTIRIIDSIFVYLCIVSYCILCIVICYIGVIINVICSCYVCICVYIQNIVSCMHSNNYKTIRNIGGGNFGRVDLVYNTTTNKQYVMKKLKQSQTTKQSIQKQIEIMRSLCHQYVIRYYDNFEDNDGNVCIIMEYAENGELERYLNMRKNCNNPLSQDEVMQWFIQMCHAIKYIHDHRVLHRDLKCENIFISAANQIKIGDFGISKNMKATFDMAQTKIGTPCVMAPQIWENKMYNQKSDIWSLGCILYKMMTFNHAFESKTTAAYVLKITSGTYPPIHGNYSTNLKNLVKMMLSLDAHNRPSVHTILQMDFIKTKVNQVLSSSISKYTQSLKPATLQKHPSLSNPRLHLIQKKRSLSSLSNSSMLTPKSTTLENTKIVELKQSYPVLVQEVKKLKQKIEEDMKKKQKFNEESKSIVQDIREKLKIGNNGYIQGVLEKLLYRIEELVET